MTEDIRTLSKWLNEELTAPIDRQALARVLAIAQQAQGVEVETLYKCIACGHLYQELVSQCDCLENPENLYETWQASPVEVTPPAPQPAPVDERADFEAWAALRWLPLNRNEIGGSSYQNGDTDLAWRAWQASATNKPIAAEPTEWQVRYIFEGGHKEDWRTIRPTTLNREPKEAAESLASMKRADGSPMYEVRSVHTTRSPTQSPAPKATKGGE